MPLSYDEICRFETHPASLDEVLLAGGYPAIFDRKFPPSDWLASYVATYIERDVRTISNVGDLIAFQRFVQLCAGRTGQLLNFSALASDCGLSQPTAKAWLSVLETSFMTFRLPPWRAGVRKRLIKMPKLHFYDTGLICRLLGIREIDHMRNHPLRGAIFETWVVSEIVKHRANRGEYGGMYFYRDRRGLEADLVVADGPRLSVVEAKAGQTASSEMFDTVHRVRDVLEAVGEIDALAVYGGQTAQRRRDGTLLPWREVAQRTW